MKSSGWPSSRTKARWATVGASIVNNTVTNSGYIGIRAFRNAIIAGNTVDTACAVLTDCGGIYTEAPDNLALNTRIENNTVTNVGRSQRLAWGIYLDNRSNAVTVSGNTVSSSGNGMLINGGHDNAISGNTFSTSTQAHIQMVEGGSGGVRNNSVTGNTFSARNGEETYRISSDVGVSSVAQFASYDRNGYTSSSAAFANYNGARIGYAQWKANTGQDAASTFTVP